MTTLHKGYGALEFENLVDGLRLNLIHYGRQVNIGEWQAIQDADRPESFTLEIEDSTIEWELPPDIKVLQDQVKPNLTWAEDHFQERISGIPHNPPPSHEWWPFARANNLDFMDDQTFSHTYPERLWPRHAGYSRGDWLQDAQGQDYPPTRQGIRFEYGDLNDLVQLLIERPATRQAYLPIWFPEDLRAARQGERVPCTLGYHFSIRKDRLTIRYTIRSCDFFRHFRDDVYMAARLAQAVAEQINQKKIMNAGGHEEGASPMVTPFRLVMHIHSLHVFANERPMLERQAEERKNQRLQEALG